MGAVAAVTLAIGLSVLALPEPAMAVGASRTSVGGSPNPSVEGQNVRIAATVTTPPLSSLGVVAFTEGTTLLGVAVLLPNFDCLLGACLVPTDHSTATLSISNLSVGSHVIRATFPGSAGTAGSSGSYTQVVVSKPKASTVTQLSSTPNPSVVGQAAFFTATVTPVPASPTVPTGTVQLVDGGFPLGVPQGIDGLGKTQFNFGSLSPGVHSIVAVYSGDDNYKPSDSNVVLQVVKAKPALSTTASAATLLGGPVRDTASLVDGVNPTGAITFRLYGPDDATCAGAPAATSMTSVAGNGSYPSDVYTPGATGSYRWTADYSGDGSNFAASSPCNAPNESVTVKPFLPPPCTSIPTGDVLGPVTVNAGDSVCITNARVVGPVTVNPGGALTVVNSQISRGIVANGPSFFSLCGSQVSGPSTTPGQGIVVSGAAVPIRIGDPAAGCAFNRVAGDVVLAGNTAGLTLGSNIFSGNVTVNNNTVGTDVIKANNISKALACSGNHPPPVNAGQPNTATSKSGQCAGL